jgi:hypothetical protein
MLLYAGYGMSVVMHTESRSFVPRTSDQHGKILMDGEVRGDLCL